MKGLNARCDWWMTAAPVCGVVGAVGVVGVGTVGAAGVDGDEVKGSE